MAGWIDKMKDYVKGNPQHADSAIEKVEDLVDDRTGGTYADQVDQGGDLLRDKLGLAPDDAPAATDAPTSSGDRDIRTTEQVDGPVPNPVPATNDPQDADTDTGAGSIVPGGPQQPGEPGGPLDPEHPAPGQPIDVQPGTADPGPDVPAFGAPGEDGPATTSPSEGLPQGGATQQGERSSGHTTPGGDQPESGGPQQP